MLRSARALPVLAALLAAAPPALADDIDAQAARLAALRADVETLSSDLELEKEDLRGRLRAIEAQNVDLEVQIRREELRLERLLAEEQKQQALLDDAQGGDDLTPVVREGLDAFRASVRAGLPFKVEDRLASLDALDAKLTDRSLSAEQASARLWAFAEDERRLSRENALGRQVISLGGEELLVDTARLGMVALYYRTPEGAFGQAVPVGDGWTWQPLTGAAEAEQVSALFDALAKGVRVGFFTLPTPLAGAR